MSLTLFMLGMIGLAALLGQWVTVKLKQQVHVQVYLQRDLSAAQIDATRLALSADASVAAASYLDPSEAAEELEAELGNPLSPSSATSLCLLSWTSWCDPTTPPQNC